MTPDAPDAPNELLRRWHPRSLVRVKPSNAARLLVENSSDDEIRLMLLQWPSVSDEGRLCPTEEEGGVPIRVSRSTLAVWQLSRFTLFGEDPQISPDQGKAFAVTLRDRDVLAAPNELSDLERLAPPLEEISDELRQAVESVFRPFAWTLWRRWRGHPELIAHVARAGQWAVEDVWGVQPSVSIRVYVGADVERFSSASELRTDLTGHAAAKLDLVKIRESAPGLACDVTMVRKHDPSREWLSKAVLLEVSTPDAGRVDDIVAIRDRIESAIDRGERRRARRNPTLRASDVAFREHTRAGEVLEPGNGPRNVIEPEFSRSSRLSHRDGNGDEENEPGGGGAGGVLLIGAGVLTYLVLGIGLTAADDPMALVVILPFTAIFTAVVFITTTPRVELGRTSLTLRLRGYARWAAVAVLSAVVPILIRMIFVRFGVKLS